MKFQRYTYIYGPFGFGLVGSMTVAVAVAVVFTCMWLLFATILRVLS